MSEQRTTNQTQPKRDYDTPSACAPPPVAASLSEEVAGHAQRTTKKRVSLKRLNTPEPKEQIIARLLVERNGQRAEVTIAEALEFRRDAYGLTAAEFAFVLGIERSHYNEIINGRRTLSKAAIRRAFNIGVPAALLLQPEAP